MIYISSANSSVDFWVVNWFWKLTSFFFWEMRLFELFSTTVKSSFRKIGYISFGRWDVKCIWKRWAIKWKQFEKELLNFSIFKYDSDFKCMKAFTSEESREVEYRQFHSVSILSLLKAWLVQVLCAKELGSKGPAREKFYYLSSKERQYSIANKHTNTVKMCSNKQLIFLSEVWIEYVNKQLNYELKM